MMISRTILRRSRGFRSSVRPLLTPSLQECPVRSPAPGVLEQHQSLLRAFNGAASFHCFAGNLIDLNFGSRVRHRCEFSSEALVDSVPVIVDVPLAQTGEGIAECELLKWFVQEGDQVEEFQSLCEVQSDKATIEITSRYKGKVAQLLYVPGDIVKVGETLLRMLAGEPQALTLTSNNLENLNPGSSELKKDYSDISEVKKKCIGGIMSTPPVRNLAKQYGINISDVHGTGKDGRVLEEDVLEYAARIGIIEEPSVSVHADTGKQFLGRGDSSPHMSAEVAHKYEDKTVPLRGFKRTMVKTMSIAAKVPHFHYVEEINCNALIVFKSSFQNNNPDPTVKHTFLPLLVKSLSMALSKYPEMNSCFNEESLELILKGSHNIGIAMATPSGLVVPNIKNVQSLSILEITKELSRLQQLAMENKLNPEDVSGGTITLSNIGSIGGKFGAPIINLPEVSIIAIGRIQKAPCFADNGTVYPVSIMTVNIGADHRVLDGATVAKFCNQWKEYIEKPELLMLNLR